MVPAIVQAMRPTVYTVRYPRRWAGNPLLYISGAMASLGDALFGYSQGIPSPAKLYTPHLRERS